MRYSQKYCIVSFLNAQPVGLEFHMSEWPLHITLADVFAIKRDDTKIDMKLEQLASTQSRLNIRAREQARLGDAEVY